MNSYYTGRCRGVDGFAWVDLARNIAQGHYGEPHVNVEPGSSLWQAHQAAARQLGLPDPDRSIPRLATLVEGPDLTPRQAREALVAGLCGNR